MGISWSDVGKTVAAAAPALATALGGPVGAVAGAAGALLASALGSETATPEAVSAAIAARPEALVRVRELEAEEKARLLEWQSTQLCAELENLKSAREREIELAKTGHGASWATSVVSLVITVGFFVMLTIVIVGGHDALGEAGVLLLGSLASSFGAVTQYYLGSSLGSAQKERYKLGGGK